MNYACSDVRVAGPSQTPSCGNGSEQKLMAGLSCTFGVEWLAGSGTTIRQHAGRAVGLKIVFQIFIRDNIVVLG